MSFSNRQGGDGSSTSSSSGAVADPGKRPRTQMKVQREAAPTAAAPAAPGSIVRAAPKQKAEGGVVGDPNAVAAPAAEAPAAEGGPAAAAPAPGKAVQGAGAMASDPDAVHEHAAQGVSGSGGALPHLDAIQASFGGHDVSGIRAHTDGAAASASRTIGAEAYATGNDVAFASSSPSLHTTAHEAAHVVQQRAGVHLKGGVGEVGDPYEQHADAVADRVVQGQSASDLLDQYGGGSAGGGAVQGKSVQLEGARPGAPAGAPAGGAATASTGNSHFEVELKAWIPHGHVVDPEEPARASDWLDTLTSISRALQPPGLNAALMYEYHSKYRGDGHTGYAGGYRVLSKASFDWDGHTISNFKQTGTYGASHRDYDYHAWLELSAGIGPLRATLGTIDVARGSNTQTATASSATSGSVVSANSFNLGISSANPLVMTWAPTIDSDLAGTIDASGNMSLSFGTDLFPSHGIQVTKDGAVIKQQVVNDPSGINGLGPVGAIDIGRRLTSHSNHGTTSAP